MSPRSTVSMALFASILPFVALGAEEPLKVGALLAVTGPASFLGTPEARTLQMLVEETNARGGVRGRKIQLVLKDTGASPEKAISLAKQLIDEEKVFAILGPTTSGETLAIKKIAEDSKTLLISCAAAELIVHPVARWVFKTPQNDSHAAIRIFQQMKKMNVSRIGVLTSNTGFGKAGKEQLEKLAPEHGIQIAANEVYDKAATDLTAEVTKLKAAGVQAIVNWSIEPAQSIVLKNARQLGLTVPIFQSHGFGNIQYAKAAGAAAEGVIFPVGRIAVADELPDDHPQKKLLVAYKRSYESRFGEEVSSFGGHGYDAFTILVRGIELGGFDAEKVRSAIESLKGLVGTAGVYQFSPADHSGLGLDSFEMVTVKNGRFVVFGK